MGGGSYDLALAVFADHEGVYAACCDAGFGCEGAAQAGGVEEGAAADYLGGR